ncbi:MAG: DUF1634 domain-containing protein [Planctomycetota bacterium]
MNRSNNSSPNSVSHRWDDTRMDWMMGNLLRGGVLLASIVVAVGGAVFLVRQGQLKPHDQIFQGEPADLRELGPILEYAKSGSGRGIIQVGILLLLATPVARVAFSVFAFLVQGDVKYVIITLIVLGALLSSMFGVIQHGTGPTKPPPPAQPHAT